MNTVTSVTPRSNWHATCRTFAGQFTYGSKRVMSFPRGHQSLVPKISSGSNVRRTSLLEQVIALRTSAGGTAREGRAAGRSSVEDTQQHPLAATTDQPSRVPLRGRGSGSTWTPGINRRDVASARSSGGHFSLRASSRHVRHTPSGRTQIRESPPRGCEGASEYVSEPPPPLLSPRSKRFVPLHRWRRRSEPLRRYKNRRSQDSASRAEARGPRRKARFRR